MKKTNSIPSIIDLLNGNVENYLNDIGIKTRKGASPGLWLCLMLPISVVLGTWNHPDCTNVYRTSTCLSIGLLLNSLSIIFQVNHSAQFRTICCAVNSVTTTMLLCYFSDHSIFFNILFGIQSSFGFNKLLLTTLQISPESFTLGEAAVIVEATILFLGAVIGTSVSPLPVVTCFDISTQILQVGITGLAVLVVCTYFFPQLQSGVEFYSVLGVVLIAIIILLHILLGFSAVVWLITIATEDTLTLKLLGSWAMFLLMAIGAVATQVRGGKKASTSVRKYFHLLALFVYLPGIIIKPCLLYVASGILMALFVGLELLRVLKLQPFAAALDSMFVVFADEKDNKLALTPIYLLVGCSAPLWLHPTTSTAPQVLLPLLSGVLSVAVGDTAASICGSWCGHHFWPDSNKTKEGTAACFISQLFLVIALIHFGYVPRNNLLQPIAAIAVVSMVEATTDQIDNLALPLVMYIILL